MSQSQPVAATAAAEEAGPLLSTRDGDVAVLTLARPQTRNSLSNAMLQGLAAALAELRETRAVRAVVLTAAGPVFSAGHDLKELQAARTEPDGGRAAYADVLGRCAAVMQAIVALPQPVIAAVQGTATAAGCQLVATCDLAVAASHAKFCTPGVNIGLFCSTPMVALSRAVGRKAAMEFLLTGDLVPAGKACALGLVNRVVADAELRAAVAALATQIVSKSPLTLKIGKRAFYHQAGMPVEDAYAYTAEIMTRNMLAHDAEEGIDAFLQKRPPVWTGR